MGVMWADLIVSVMLDMGREGMEGNVLFGMAKDVKPESTEGGREVCGVAVPCGGSSRMNTIVCTVWWMLQTARD